MSDERKKIEELELRVAAIEEGHKLADKITESIKVQGSGCPGCGHYCTCALPIPDIKPIGETSDGYHTFNELYDHRHALFIALCKTILEVGNYDVWRSTLNSDGSHWKGWFILGIFKRPGDQIAYHLPDSLWGSTHFAETLDRAPEYDGHTPADTLRRVKTL